jgi:hypothetical protein
MGQQQRIGPGARATTVVCTNGRIAVTYHSTLVVEATPDSVTLDSGGWLTATTKTRMNQTSNQFDLGYHVYASKGLWHVSYPTKGGGFQDVLFRDLITFERV